MLMAALLFPFPYADKKKTGLTVCFVTIYLYCKLTLDFRRVLF